MERFSFLCVRETHTRCVLFNTTGTNTWNGGLTVKTSYDNGVSWTKLERDNTKSGTNPNHFVPIRDVPAFNVSLIEANDDYLQRLVITTEEITSDFDPRQDTVVTGSVEVLDTVSLIRNSDDVITAACTVSDKCLYNISQEGITLNSMVDNNGFRLLTKPDLLLNGMSLSELGSVAYRISGRFSESSW